MSGAAHVVCRWENNGRRLVHDIYSSGGARELLPGRTTLATDYPCDLSGCPTSVAIIPALANILPMAWLGGFDVHAEEVDKVFADNMRRAAPIWAKRHRSRLVGQLHAREVSAPAPGDDKTSACLCLFSGGLDAATTVRRQLHLKPRLVLIRGADIPLADDASWGLAAMHASQEADRLGLELELVSSNLRDFYDARKLERALGRHWWGRVQHGMGLLGVCAPLSWLRGARKVFIASSFKRFSGDWGSSRETDELTSWSACDSIHDGYDLGRQEKADMMAACPPDQRPLLRVCWQPGGANCLVCEKCVRTSLNLSLAAADPADFGLGYDRGAFQSVINRLHGEAPGHTMLEFWGEIEDRALGLAIEGNGASCCSDELLSFLGRKPITGRLRLNKSKLRRALARIGLPRAPKVPA